MLGVINMRLPTGRQKPSFTGLKKRPIRQQWNMAHARPTRSR